MKERPILMNGAMVRAVLNGTKTQTRRILDESKTFRATRPYVNPRWEDGRWCCETPEGMHIIVCINNPEIAEQYSPYGKPGDLLWVRENFQPFLNDDCDGDMRLANWKTGENYNCTYPATDGVHEFVDADDNLRDSVKPSIHMPRWASRILLEIVGIRVERLQDISESDALAEGITITGDGAYHVEDDKFRAPSAKESYARLWESINGDGSWDANHWVWVIEFKEKK